MPNHWGSLSQEFALCTTGDRQSPIDLSGYIEARSAPALIFNYSENALEIKHNGKIAHVEYGEGNTLILQRRVMRKHAQVFFFSY